MRNALIILALLFTQFTEAKLEPSSTPSDVVSEEAIPDPSPVPSPTPSATPRLLIWTESARRFTGDTEKVRKKSIQALKKYPNLKKELKKALGSADHFLALDVISVLQIRDMLKDLMAFSERDHTGYSYHVMNSLLEKKDEEKITDLYLERIDLEKTSPASKMAILDALARMNTLLGDKRVSRLLQDESPEVRSATLSLIRAELVKKNVQRNFKVLEKTLQDPAFQIRIQTLYLISELPASFRRANLIQVNSLLEACAKDSSSQVRTLCTAVGKGIAE